MVPFKTLQTTLNQNDDIDSTVESNDPYDAHIEMS